MDGAGVSKKRAGAAAAPGRGWLPAQVRRAPGGDMIDWVQFGDRRLSEPFFADSVARAVRFELKRIGEVSTPLADLPAMAAPPALAPSCFIFHMSRCGSTLVARMLAASDEAIVVSEAAPIDAVVRLEDAGADRVRLLRAMVGALGQVRRGERRYVVKLDSWHALALPLFRAAFPATPWVFVYRDPAEVMVSHLRRAGLQMSGQIPPGFFGLDPVGAWGAGYYASVLAATCEGAIRAWTRGGGLLVRYDELPQAVWTRILPHFGDQASSDDLAQMAAVARLDGRSLEQPFVPDSAAKQAEVTAAIRAAMAPRLAGAFAELERLRAGG
jgi:hypothetical protein